LEGFFLDDAARQYMKIRSIERRRVFQQTALADGKKLWPCRIQITSGCHQAGSYAIVHERMMGIITLCQLLTMTGFGANRGVGVPQEK